MKLSRDLLYDNLTYDVSRVKLFPMSLKELRDKKSSHSPLYKSFGYAFRGIGVTVRDERNIKIHLLAVVLVVIFGLWLHISTTEWYICLILFGLVIGMELMNTAVESVVDLVTDEKKDLARKAKDAAAGAVLVSAIISAVIGLNIFIPKLAIRLCLLFGM